MDTKSQSQLNRISMLKKINEKQTTIEEELKKDDVNRRKHDELCCFYHGGLNKENAERQLLNHRLFGSQNGLFLIRDEFYGSTNYILSLVFKNKCVHFKIEHLEDAYFRLTNDPVIHGLDELVRVYMQESGCLPCKLKTFIKNYPPPNSSRLFGITLVLHRVSLESSIDMLTQVLKNKLCPQINIKDSNGSTALHSACYMGNLSIVRALLDAGADVNIRDKHGNTPLHLACAANHPAIVHILIQKFNANLNDKNPDNSYTPLHTAAKFDSVDVINILLNVFCAVHKPRTDKNETPEDIARVNEAHDAVFFLSNYSKSYRPLKHAQNFLHSRLSYNEAKMVLESVGKQDGLFIISRTKHQDRLSLSLYFYFKNEFNLFEIQQVYKGFYIGNGPYFDTLEQLVDAYKNFRMNLPCELTSYLSLNGHVESLHDDGKKSIVEVSSLNTSGIFSNASNLSLDSENIQTHVKLEYLQLPKVKRSLPEIDPNHIGIVRKIGNGEFGDVFEGTLMDSKGMIIPIAIKQLKSGGDYREFLSEAKIMGSLNHPCILRIFGICHEQRLIAIELMAMGSMLNFLQTRYNELNIEILKLWSVQIAHGMMYLEQKNLVHRDLAARNVLVASMQQVKITDFGLTRKLDSWNVYIQDATTRVPLKWYPLEAVEQLHFTTKSDVWSYGICLYEIFSFGATPYGNATFEQVLQFLHGGGRLECPTYCPRHVYGLMLNCWNLDPNQRPSFRRITNYLSTCPDFSQIEHQISHYKFYTT